MHVTACHITKEQVAQYFGREVPNYEALGLDSEKIYGVFRPGDELAKAAKSFEGLPLQLEHHYDSAVDPQKNHRVGSLGTDAEYNSPYLDVSLHITDQAAIDAINHGDFKEISASYMYDPIREDGTFNGVPYQVRMSNIRGNHAALVREGRAGPDVAVADSNTVGGNPKKGVDHMNKVTMDALARAFASDEQLCGLSVPVSALASAVNAALAPAEEAPTVEEGAPDTPADASLDEIIAEYLGTASEEEKQAIKAMIEKLRSDKPEPVEAEPTPDAEPEAPADEEEKAEPAPVEPVKAEGEEEPKPEQPEEAPAPASDADTVRAQVKEFYKGLVQAAQDCRPIIGDIDLLAFDSAEAIYRKALSVKGFDATGVAADSLPAMIKFVNQVGTAPAFVASDAKGGTDDGADIAGLSRIRIL